MVRRPVKPAPTRRYDATSRQQAAYATRQRILAAARDLFLTRGYAGTTMTAIAAAAGVSVETIYLSVGAKAALVRYLVETALSGTDQPVPALQRAGVQAIVAEPDPRRKVSLFARLVRQLQERLAPIWAVVVEAAPRDAELAALITELNQRHVRSMRQFVEDLAATGGLRAEVPPDRAADIVWAMNSAAFYRLLVIDRGWSGDTLEQFLADAWQQLLLPASPSEPRLSP